MTYKTVEYRDPEPGEMRCPFCDADVTPTELRNYCQHYVASWHDETEDDEFWEDLAIRDDSLDRLRELLETALRLSDEYLSRLFPDDPTPQLREVFGPHTYELLFESLSSEVARMFTNDVFEKSPNEYVEFTADYSGGRPMSSIGTTILASDRGRAAKDLTAAARSVIPDLERGVRFLREQLDLGRHPRDFDPTRVAHERPFSERSSSDADEVDPPF